MSPHTTIRFDDEDRALIARLKQQLGITSTSQLVRTALRVLDQWYLQRYVERGETPPDVSERGGMAGVDTARSDAE